MSHFQGHDSSRVYLEVPTSEKTALRCGECGLPWAYVQGSVLIVESVHHGKKHTNVIAIRELAQMLET